VAAAISSGLPRRLIGLYEKTPSIHHYGHNPYLSRALDALVERAGAHQAQHFVGARHLRHEAAAGEQAASVLVEFEPHADGLVGGVLEQQLHAARAPLMQAFAKGAGHHQVLTEIDGVEQAGIA
jgi:hypothetical protein